MTTPVPTNVLILIRLEEEIIGYGWNQIHKPKQNFCEYVAEKTGEVGQDSPSDNAIKFAKRVVARYKGMNKHAKSFLLKKLDEKKPQPANRYPMGEDQPAQIDCRETRCVYHD